jgi:hypothetical protein
MVDSLSLGVKCLSYGEFKNKIKNIALVTASLKIK